MRQGGLVASPARSPCLKPLDFFQWGCMKSNVYHDAKPEARHRLVQAMEEAGIGTRNKLGQMQWQHQVAQHLVAHMQSNG
jgi:hypothetical protein